MKVYGVDLNQALPMLPIPLRADETLAFDFNAVYQHTFQVRRLFTLIDYAQEPARISTYSPAHQAVIRQRMAELALERRAT